MRAATSLLMAGALLVISLSRCGADDLIRAETIAQGSGVFSTGADTMSLLSKLFEARTNETRTARQRPSLVRDSI